MVQGVDSSSVTHPPDLPALQRRTLRLLFVSQVLGGVGVAVGMSVGALLAAEMVSVGVSGLAQSAVVLGAALFAIPAARIVQRSGRRPSLAALYAVAALGAAFVVLAVAASSVAMLFFGFFLFGGAQAASMQARYAAVDLSPKELYGRHISLIVWATTLGGVVGPNLGAIAARTLEPYAIPPLAAPFGFSVALFTLVAVILFALMRPDPMEVVRASAATAASGAATGGAASPTAKSGLREAIVAVRSNGNATLGVAATAIGHVVMVGVMSMTPVHIRGAGHGAADTIKIVGVVISIHIAGMYAFAPLMGWLSDRVGRQRVILGGVALLLTACAVAGTAGHDTTQLAIGLFLLGLGWSATMVSGSALLAASTTPAMKPAVQGLSDLVMGLAGALAGALSGVVVAGFGFPALTLAAASMTVPLAVAAMRRSQPQ
jgi:MFS family permease